MFWKYDEMGKLQLIKITIWGPLRSEFWTSHPERWE